MPPADYTRREKRWLWIHLLQHAGESGGLAQVVDVADPGDGALDAEPEADMRHAAIAPQVEIPFIGRARQLVLLDALLQQLQAGRALAAPDNLAITLRGEQVGT